VATIAGVLFVNDSKATTVASTLVALESCDAPIHLILGGQGKGEDYEPLREPVADRCAGVYLIGEEAERLHAVVGGERCETLERAVTAAASAARAGEVVLLSPACTSFDQFADFEARGRAFKELVAARRT
jgi:UDP-N-acetylmuramoylalanine--D-glutamate ligase